MFSYRWSESSATTDSSDDELMDLEQIMDSDTGIILWVPHTTSSVTPSTQAGFFASKSLTALVKSSVTMSNTYTEQFLLHRFTRCKQDPMYVMYSIADLHRKNSPMNHFFRTFWYHSLHIKIRNGIKCCVQDYVRDKKFFVL